MNHSLEEFLSAFSSLGHCIALVFAALGCRRIRLAGGDKAFGIAALLALASLGLYAAAYLADWLFAFWYQWNPSAPYVFASKWIHAGYQVNSFLLLLFTAVFATGCFRSARRGQPGTG